MEYVTKYIMLALKRKQFYTLDRHQLRLLSNKEELFQHMLSLLFSLIPWLLRPED